MHHKPGLKPLDEQSKTGQTIAKLEKELEKRGYEVIKTNLYNTYALPKNEDKEKLVQEWLNTNKPSGSIVVSLGTIVQQEIYPRQEEFGGNVIYETHPAALFGAMAESRFLTSLLSSIDDKSEIIKNGAATV